MYVVFQNGGKQYRVSEGQIIRLEKLNIKTDESIEFTQVMMIADNNNIQIGCPFISGSKITAMVVAHGRSDKVMIIKFRRRKHFRKHQGHRQWFTDIKITNISFNNE